MFFSVPKLRYLFFVFMQGLQGKVEKGEELWAVVKYHSRVSRRNFIVERHER